jgi:hypothetical protein
MLSDLAEAEEIEGQLLALRKRLSKLADYMRTRKSRPVLRNAISSLFYEAAANDLRLALVPLQSAIRNLLHAKEGNVAKGKEAEEDSNATVQ